MREFFTPEVIKILQVMAYAGAFVGSCIGAYIAKRYVDKKMAPITHEMVDNGNGSLKSLAKRNDEEIRSIRTDQSAMKEDIKTDIKAIHSRFDGVDSRLSGMERNISTIMEVVLKDAARR